MWYPATVAAADSPISSAQAKAQCRIDASDTTFDDELARLIATARGHVEAVCGVRFAEREGVVLKCDSFDDFAKLPEAPVSAAVVTYVDGDGATQTLSTDVYELRGDGLEASIVLKYGQSWPSIQPGSRITVTATVGYATAPDAVVHAMLMLVAWWFAAKEPVNIGNIVTPLDFAVDALLTNYRRNA